MALIRCSGGSGGSSSAKDMYWINCGTASNCACGEYTFGTKLDKTDSARVIIVITFAEPTDISYNANTNVVKYYSDYTAVKDNVKVGTASNVIGVSINTSGQGYITVTKTS